MNTLLVPTDFSSTARNAAMYAIKFGEQMGTKKIVFYHAYQAPVSVDPLVPNILMPDMDTLKKDSEQALQHFILSVKSFCNIAIQLDGLSEYNLLSDGLDEVCKKTGAELIIMGITGVSALEERLIGSNTISVAKNGTVPVIIVPPDACYNPIKEVALTCDYKKVVETTPVDPIKKILDASKAKLFVLNVDNHNQHFDAGTPFEGLLIDTLLYGYHPEYHFLDSKDFIKSVNQFVLDKQIDLIISIPKKQGFFQDLFRTSHTQRLAYHSHVPLMVIHE